MAACYDRAILRPSLHERHVSKVSLHAPAKNANNAARHQERNPGSMTASSNHCRARCWTTRVVLSGHGCSPHFLQVPLLVCLANCPQHYSRFVAEPAPHKLWTTCLLGIHHALITMVVIVGPTIPASLGCELRFGPKKAVTAPGTMFAFVPRGEAFAFEYRSRHPPG